MDWDKALLALFGLAGTCAAAFFAYKAKKTEVVKTNEQAMIDQLQEQQAAADLRATASDAKFKDLEFKVDKLLSRDTRSRQFIWELIAHINTNQGPPAPQWPAELL